MLDGGLTFCFVLKGVLLGAVGGAKSTVSGRVDDDDGTGVPRVVLEALGRLEAALLSGLEEAVEGGRLLSGVVSLLAVLYGGIWARLLGPTGVPGHAGREAMI